MQFSHNQKRDLVIALRKLRRDKRVAKERLTFQDVEKFIWNLPPSRFERFTESLHGWLTKFQGK